MAEAEQVSGGLILRGDDGSLYFIRDEVLDACKTDGEYTERVESMLEGGEVEGFAFTLGTTQLSPLKTVQVDTTLAAPRTDFTRRSTIMCPW